MVEETVYDRVPTCDHSYDKRCHTSYITQYEAHQEEECEEEQVEGKGSRDQPPNAKRQR